jgi:polyhydroxyalkanoate synthesis regulator phasin
MSTYPKREHIIKAILSNEKLSEDEKSELISDLMEEFKATYPELQYHATKSDVKEVELKLTKEIREVDIRLTKEIGEVKAEIAKSKSDTIKFVAGMMIGQVFVIAGLVAGIFKYFIQG